MEDDEPFFACDDDFVWPVLSSSDKIPYVGVTMCSVPYTPESNSNSKDKAANLGFSSKRNVQNSDKEFLVKLTEDSGKDVVEDVKEEGNNKEFRVNLTENSSFLVEEIENVKEGEKNKALRRSNSLLRASKLLTKSSLMVEDGNHGIEFIKEGEKNEVNLAAKASKLEANSRLKLEDDNNEIGTVKNDKGFRANLSVKDLKLSTNLGAKSRLKVGNEVMKKEGIRVRKASKLEGKTSVSAMECLIEVLKHTCEVKENEDADILATVTRRGMTFPLPRGRKKPYVSG